ncbi:fimbria/pilus chaperone family protein [Klebsiella aerogenes]
MLRDLSVPLLMLALALKSTLALATGMVPETSLLLINEQDKGANMNVKNTDDHPSLLYTSIVDLPDDKGTHVVVTQPVTRVEAGQTQRLRFILQTDAPLKVEHLKRLHLEGIPPKTKGKNQVTINIRQDLPVLIHPASLPVKKDAWTLLTWSVSGNVVTVKNDSPYVVRMSSQVRMLPSGIDVTLDRTYILPGQSISAKAGRSLSGDRQVTFYPASRYGVQVPSYTADVR